ncbi:hypothetical protein GCM10027347_45110 [Larkinella harenae]
MKVTQIVDAVLDGLESLKGENPENKIYCSQHAHPDNATASERFARAKEKLFAVESWSSISNLTARFLLHDSNGKPKPAGRPAVGDYIKIILPGPTPKNWVNVVRVIDEERKAEFTARPCADPNGKSEQTAHFFSASSTSTFRVELRETTVIASQIGQNEQINNQQPQAGDRAVVNTVIAGTGRLFYQRIQWQTLTDYLVD